MTVLCAAFSFIFVLTQAFADCGEVVKSLQTAPNIRTLDFGRHEGALRPIGFWKGQKILLNGDQLRDHWILNHLESETVGVRLQSSAFEMTLIPGMSWSDDGNFVVGQGLPDGKGKLFVWDTNSGSLVGEKVLEEAHGQAAKHIVSANGEFIAYREVGSDLVRVFDRLFSTSAGRFRQMYYSGHLFPAFTPDGKKLVTVSYEFQQPIPKQPWFQIEQTLHITDLSGGQNYEFKVSDSFEIESRVRSVRGLKRILNPLLHQVGISNMAFDKSGDWLVFATATGTANFANMKSRTLLRKELGIGMVSHIRFSPDQRLVVFVGLEGISGWELSSPKQIWTQKLPRTQPTGILAISPDSTKLAIMCADADPEREVIRLIDMKSGKVLRTIDLRFSATSEIAFSQNGRSLRGVDSLRDLIRTWDVATGQPIEPDALPAGLVRKESADRWRNSTAFPGLKRRFASTESGKVMLIDLP